MANTTEIWSDLHQSFVTDSHGRIKRSVNIDAVMTSIDNIIGTSQGERVMLPTFASRMKDLLFEPMDETLGRLISDELKRVIEAWDDRPSITGIDIVTDPTTNFVAIHVHFTIKGYPEAYTYTKAVS
jgi:phage baseplate assembly protein W